MRILLKEWKDIEYLKKTIDTSKFYRAHIEVINDKVYAIITKNIK